MLQLISGQWLSKPHHHTPMQLCVICTHNYKAKAGQRQTGSVPAVTGSVQRCLCLSHTPVSGLSLHTCLIVPVSLLVPLRQCFPSGYFPLWTLLPFMSPLNPLAKGHCTKTALCNDWTEEERKVLIIVKHRDDVASNFMTILKKKKINFCFGVISNSNVFISTGQLIHLP